MLEERHRQYVVQHFEKFLSLWKTKNYFNMLVQWCPQKIPLLVEDGFKHFKEVASKTCKETYFVGIDQGRWWP